MFESTIQLAAKWFYFLWILRVKDVFFPPHKFYNVGERSRPAADEAIFLFTLAKVKLSSSQKWFGSSFAQGTHSYFVTLHHIFRDLQLAAELEEQVPAWLIFPRCVVPVVWDCCCCQKVTSLCVESQLSSLLVVISRTAAATSCVLVRGVSCRRGRLGPALEVQTSGGGKKKTWLKGFPRSTALPSQPTARWRK